MGKENIIIKYICKCTHNKKTDFLFAVNKCGTVVTIDDLAKAERFDTEHDAQREISQIRELPEFNRTWTTEKINIIQV